MLYVYLSHMCRKRIIDSHWSAAVSFEGEIKSSDEKELGITVLNFCLGHWLAEIPDTDHRSAPRCAVSGWRALLPLGAGQLQVGLSLRKKLDAWPEGSRQVRTSI